MVLNFLSLFTHIESRSAVLLRSKQACPAEYNAVGYVKYPSSGLIKLRPSTPLSKSFGIRSSGMCLPCVALCFDMNVL